MDHVRVQCRHWWHSAGCWQVHSEVSAVTGGDARSCCQRDLVGVDLRRMNRRGTKLTGWMQSGELERKAAGNADWLARLRGKDRESKSLKWVKVRK